MEPQEVPRLPDEEEDDETMSDDNRTEYKRLFEQYIKEIERLEATERRIEELQRKLDEAKAR